MKKVNCEKLKIYHAWGAIKSEKPYSPSKVRLPLARRRCKNCGKTQKYIVTQEEITEWVDE